MCLAERDALEGPCSHLSTKVACPSMLSASALRAAVSCAQVGPSGSKVQTGASRVSDAGESMSFAISVSSSLQQHSAAQLLTPVPLLHVAPSMCTDLPTLSPASSSSRVTVPELLQAAGHQA